MTPKQIISEKRPGASKLRQQAEEKLGKKKQATQPVMEADTQPRAGTGTTTRLVHELQVHQIELEMQNEELIQSRAEAEALNRQYTDLYDFAPVGYFTLRRNGTISRVNLAGANLLGVERGNLVKRRLGLFVSVESRAAFSAFLEKLLSGEGKETCEVTLLKNGNELLWARLETTCFEGGQECRAVMTDITERKQAEQKLHAYSEHLEEMVEERTRALTDAQEQLVRHEKLAVLGQLAGGVGHELRNPLGVINNAIYYLKLIQPDADDKVRKYHVMIEQEVHNAEKIITDLLDFARSISADREPVSVPALVERVLSRFPAPPSVEVALKLSADLPKVFVDPRQMEQVLGNLVVNAYQAMPNGGQLLVLSRVGGSVISEQLSGKTDLLVTDHRVLIAFKDTGVGIPPENMQKLFEPLFTTKCKGIGLGLAVSQKLAEANGGRIEVQSEAGKGSTFTLFLPVQEDEQ